MGAKYKDGKGQLYTIEYNIKNPLRIEDDGGLEGAIELAAAARRAKGITNEQYENIVKGMRSNSAGFELLRDALEKNGYDGLVYRNVVEGKGDDSLVNLRKEQLKIIKEKNK